MKADLHIHSVHSNDGEKAIPEIIQQCIDQGLDTFSVTDHNCIGGAREAKRLLTEDQRISFIPGIEIDCSYNGTDSHLLGYQVDLENDEFDTLELNNRKRHLDAIPKMIKNLAQLGIEIDQQELMQMSGGEPPTGEQFAELLLQKPEQASNPSLKPYLPGGERSDMPLINFYLDFFAQGKPAYVKIDHIPFREAVDLVKSKGGIPIIAHPGLNLKGREDEIHELLDRGAAGLEVFNNYHDSRQVEYFAEQCRKRSVIMTCGSDYHGKNKPLISIGQFSDTEKYKSYLELSLTTILESAPS